MPRANMDRGNEKIMDANAWLIANTIEMDQNREL
jgi:hypothetical protein